MTVRFTIQVRQRIQQILKKNDLFDRVSFRSKGVFGKILMSYESACSRKIRLKHSSSFDNTNKFIQYDRNVKLDYDKYSPYISNPNSNYMQVFKTSLHQCNCDFCLCLTYAILMKVI